MKHAVFRSVVLCVAVMLLRSGEISAQGNGGSGAVTPDADRQVTAQFYAERGLLVEILGLQRWTPTMLSDSVRVHARGRSFASRSLPATLREKLGFADAVWEQTPGDSGLNVLVILLEPQDSVRVRRRVIAGDTAAPSRAPWPLLVKHARTQRSWLADVLGPPAYARAVGRPPVVPVPLRPDSTAVREVWTVLAAHRSESDLTTARQLLTSSPSPHDRLAALSILTNFERDDRAWHAAVGALLDADTLVSDFADRVLGIFGAYASRRVDWRPATTDLHAILDGSALFALPRILDLLVRTGIGPELAAPLLHDGGHAVLLLAGASSPAVRRASYRFLRAVSGGADRGGMPAEWQSWIAELRP